MMQTLQSLPVSWQTVLLLMASNVFMTFAWYGHLKNLATAPWYIAALISWGIALFEYLLQVPANRIGHQQFSVGQLKIMQEVITLVVFVPFAVLYLREPLKLDYLWAALCMVGAVYYLSALRISPSAGFDPNWSSICIFIVMVGGIGSIEGPLVGALLYFAADRLFGRFGATYMVVLGLMTLCMALFARGGLWGLWCKRVDAPWFPLRRRLLRRSDAAKT